MLFEVETQEQWDYLIDKASSWKTCACGQLSIKIPRWFLDRSDCFHAPGAPKDDKLRKLGILFMEAIEDKNAQLAHTYLLSIQRRSEIILKQLNDVEDK